MSAAADGPNRAATAPSGPGAARSDRLLVQRFAPGRDNGPTPDDLIVEAPLSIQLDGTLVTTTMRTPGHDVELAAGFCFNDGLLAGAPILGCHSGDADVVSIDTGGVAPTPNTRLTTTSSSCGLCGSESIDRLTERLTPLAGVDPFPLELLAELPDRAMPHQPLFASTGAVHAAGAFDRSGELVVLREDIGRHNAVDKVVGRLLLDGHLASGPTAAPGPADLALYVSGRASFEMVQKAWAAGFAAVVAVSAPSSLAVRTAERAQMQLAGFARNGGLNLYASGSD